MKVGVVIYHKDILNIYKQRWIDRCIDSIKAQTFQDFKVFELCYSNNFKMFYDGPGTRAHTFYCTEMENHIHAMNFILDAAFKECDVVFNINLDDYYDPNRFELQLEAIKEGYDLVSSNFQLIRENTENENEDNLLTKMIFHDWDIKAEQDKNHNILAHPVICYTKGFWERNKHYNTDELGFEDFSMWKKAVANGEKIKILEQILLYYRLSDKQTGRVNPATH